MQGPTSILRLNRRHAIALSAALLATACGGGGAGAGNRTKVTMATVGPISPLLSFLWVGKYFGWYEQAGIDINFEASNGAGEAIQKVATGNVELTLPPPSIYLSSAAQGRALPLVGVYELRRKGQYHMSVLPNSPIHELADINGKRIGVSSLGDEGVTFAKAVARVQLRLPESAVEVVPVGAGGEAAAALRQGNVDALALPDAQTSLLASLGVDLRFLPEPSFADVVFGNEFTVRSDYLKKNPDVVKGATRVIARSSLFYMTNPEAAAAIHFKLYPQTVPSGMSAQDAVKSSGAQAGPTIEEFRVDNDKSSRGKFGFHDQAAWEGYAYTYLGLDRKALPDVTRFYTNDAIDYANDFDQKEVVDLAKNFDTAALIKEIGH